MIIPNIWKIIKFMFQTTSQIRSSPSSPKLLIQIHSRSSKFAVSWEAMGIPVGHWRSPVTMAWTIRVVVGTMTGWLGVEPWLNGTLPITHEILLGEKKNIHKTRYLDSHIDITHLVTGCTSSYHGYPPIFHARCSFSTCICLWNKAGHLCMVELLAGLKTCLVLEVQ